MRKILLFLCFSFLLGGIFNQIAANRIAGKTVQAATHRLDNHIFLPIVEQSDQFANRTSAIWANAASPSIHEVALFRKSFWVDSTVSTPTLSIFADTRYEIWVDGVWVGRGPARFLRIYHEYDQYVLEDFGPGEHLVSILVQWSPNERRSESTTPYLQAALTANKFDIRTDPSWKVFLPMAWQTNPALVHSWGLIGATELLDLRTLPSDWMQPHYSDAAWPYAVSIDPTQINLPSLDVFGDVNYGDLFLPQLQTGFSFLESPRYVMYAARSIPMLVQTEKEYTLIEQGLLSPHRKIVELFPAQVSDPVSIQFETTSPQIFDIFMLRSENIFVPASISLDETNLNWVPTNLYSVDIYQASVTLPIGEHVLKVSGIPLQGVTLSVPNIDVNWFDPPFAQGSHAGRRLLLASYNSDESFESAENSSPNNITLPEGPSYFILDLGRTTYGRLQMTVTGLAGTVIDVGWDERLAGDPPRPWPFPGALHPQWNQVDSWILDGFPREISTIDARTGRYVLVAIWADTPVLIENIKIFEEHYPLVQSGNFESDNSLLNRIWQIGAESAFINMTDAYTDTPWRERGQWWGDAYVIDHVNRVAFGDLDLLRRGLFLMAQEFGVDGRPVGLSPHGDDAYLMDYGMLWLHSFQEYVMLSNDRDLAQELYPTMLAFLSFLETYKNSETGLLDLPEGHWSQNSYIDTNGYESRFGQSAAVNAMYVATLMKAAKVARDLGSFSQANIWEDDAAQIRQAMFLELFRVDTHRYVTRIDDAGVYPPTAHAQAWPLAYGAVPPEETDEVMTSLFELLSNDPAHPTINVYGMYWVLEALGQAGYIQEAVDLIENFYGYMLSEGATTWWEGFNASQHQWESLSHGWGGSPTWFLSTYVLGARQVGEKSWVVQPAFDGVDSVAGQIPVGKDVLGVDWDQPSCQEQNLQIDAPAGTSGQVILSPDSLTQITLDGTVIWQDGVSYSDNVWVTSTTTSLQLGEGRFVIDLRRNCE